MRNTISALLFFVLVLWIGAVVAQTPPGTGGIKLGSSTGTIVEVFVKN